MTAPVLVVDDDTAILQGILLLLGQAGYSVCPATTGTHALDLLASPNLPALVILDLLLPGCDGFTICRTIRRLPVYIPVLMLSARDELVDKVLGLETGADDYLTKPFEPPELLARVRALLRFKQHATGQEQAEAPLVYGCLTLWPASHRAEVAGEELDLTPKEWALLETFLRHPDQVFGRETLLRQVWGYEFGGDSRTVDVHIQRLRARLEARAAGSFIQTVRGFGYRLAPGTARAVGEL